MSALARDGTRAVLTAGALAVVCTLSARARAHRIGLSQGEYSLSGNGVDGRLTFSASDLIGALPNLDADGDGRLSTEELGRGRDGIQSKIVDRIRVTNGHDACPGALKSVGPTTEDGVGLVTRHDCATHGDVRADLGFLADLERGHRHVARVPRVGGTKEIVLYDGNARLELGSAAASSSRASVVEYGKLGIEHILTGADHLLFLLGVVLLPASLRSLLFAVTAFTLAHSLSLVLATVGMVTVSGAWVEPLIAVSVAYIGVENWFLGDASRRWRLTFAFGLVHGLGFAGALRDVNIPAARLPAALAGFNLGVELGQLLVVMAVWAVVRKLRERPWYRPRVLATTSVALALVGSVWCVERTGLFRERTATAAAGAPIAVPTATGRGAPATTQPTDETVPPLVTELCRSLYGLPRQRRAECEGTKPGISLAPQCARLLGASVRSGAVSLVETDANRCLADWNRRYEGCDFTGRASLPPVLACERVLVGNLGPDAACRSSLECAAGLHCDGVGPMDPGHCRAPGGDGASCGLSVDPLLAYVQGVAGGERSECAGACMNNRCTGVKSAGVSRTSTR